MRARRALTLTALLAATALAACGSGGGDKAADRTPTAPARSVPAQRESPVTEARNAVIDDANAALRRAAAARDVTAIRDAEQRLDALADPNLKPTRARQPFDRFVDQFRFKQAPLYVQQLTTERDSHLVYVSVLPGVFCLGSRADRVRAVAAVYGPAFRRLADRGEADLVMRVVALTRRDTTSAPLLALGRDGVVRLSKTGARCRT